MSKTPRRFKTVEELTPDEHLDHIRSGRLPETGEYQERRREALEDAGLLDEGDDGDDPATGDMTPAEHLRDIRRER
jgi:hypothetical protein